VRSPTLQSCGGGGQSAPVQGFGHSVSPGLHSPGGGGGGQVLVTSQGCGGTGFASRLFEPFLPLNFALPQANVKTTLAAITARLLVLGKFISGPHRLENPDSRLLPAPPVYHVKKYCQANMALLARKAKSAFQSRGASQGACRAKDSRPFPLDSRSTVLSFFQFVMASLGSTQLIKLSLQKTSCLPDDALCAQREWVFADLGSDVFQGRLLMRGLFFRCSESPKDSH